MVLTAPRQQLPQKLKHAYPAKFYARDTLDVARDLLGATLCRRLRGGRFLYGEIVEVEAYKANDPASHAYRGYTPRSSTLFGPPGLAYVYFIYGMYHCLNVVTEAPGVAGAVLIRAVDSVNTNGPGKLCREWKIDLKHNRLSLMDPSAALWIAPGKSVSESNVAASPRIGLSTGTDLLWRFYIKEHKTLSVQPKDTR